ncbi:hypothetical protein AB3X91_34350 [Paraburkholderia sp. BR14263]|uniref:hypothetical protein n=1 Tax=unclassified Paraburkholderia TaxID=2615204 RepID=UPI0034CF7B61
MMYTQVVPFGLLTAYGLGYYALFIGGPAVQGRATPGPAHAELPNYHGREAVQMFLMTCLGVGAAFVGFGGIVASLIWR